MRQANERLKRRDEQIDKLNARLNSTIEELNAVNSRAAKLQREKAELASRAGTPPYSPMDVRGLGASNLQRPSSASGLRSTGNTPGAPPRAATAVGSTARKSMSTRRVSSSSEEDFYQGASSSSRTERTASRSRVETKTNTWVSPQLDGDLQGDDSSGSDCSRDAGELRDLWGQIPDMYIPGRRGSQEGGGPNSDLAMLKRRMRAKKTVAVDIPSTRAA